MLPTACACCTVLYGGRFCNEKMYLFEAEGVRLGSTLSNDEDEITETVLMSKDEVRQALANDEIKDGKTLIGLQYWLMKD